MYTTAHRIILVDEHPCLRKGLDYCLSSQLDVQICGEADSDDQAMELVEAHRPHLVIFEIGLKHGHGLELIKRVKAKHSDTKLLVFSSRPESPYAERAVLAGAHGYISKSQEVSEVVKAVSMILNGERYVSAAISERLMDRAMGVRNEDSAITNLTDRELQVFELIANGLTTRAIAQTLHVSRHTIDTHRENIKRKLHLASSAELASAAVHWRLESE